MRLGDALGDVQARPCPLPDLFEPAQRLPPPRHGGGAVSREKGCAARGLAPQVVPERTGDDLAAEGGAFEDVQPAAGQGQVMRQASRSSRLISVEKPSGFVAAQTALACDASTYSAWKTAFPARMNGVSISHSR